MDLWAKSQISLGVYQSDQGSEVPHSLYTSDLYPNLCHQCCHQSNSTFGWRKSEGMGRHMKRKCSFLHHSLFFHSWSEELFRSAPLSLPFCELVHWRKWFHLQPCFLSQRQTDCAISSFHKGCSPEVSFRAFMRRVLFDDFRTKSVLSPSSRLFEQLWDVFDAP